MPFLDWVNKAKAVAVAGQVAYHLLNFESAHGDGATNAASADNLLIQGDNLLALKALLPFYRGRVKCVFIDPPYNTQSAFEHYDDKLEHSQWLSMMHPRLVLLRELLSEDGSIWITIDDNEAHYLKVLMDEVFGRGNFVANALWQKVYSERMDAVGFSNEHDHLFCYRKTSEFTVGRLPKSQNAKQFNLIDSITGRAYRRRSLRKEGSESLRIDRPSMWYAIQASDGTDVYPVKPDGTEGRWRWMRETYDTNRDEVEFVHTKGRWEIYVKQWLDEDASRPPSTIWLNEEVGHNHEAKLEAQRFNKTDTFSTPKPERLLQRVLTIASAADEIVLDSFSGSGTTAAVAHKMGRRYIGIELGEHARTHCLPRLEKVIGGEQGGISESVAWQGGGGFRFYTLGEAVFDAEGGINPAVRFGPLAGYLWHFETGEAATKAAFDSPLLGVHGDSGTAVFLLYNGILGDRRPQGGNVLTSAVLAHLKELLVTFMTTASPVGQPRPARCVVYGEMTRLSDQRLADAGVTFRQIPYDIKAR